MRKRKSVEKQRSSKTSRNGSTVMPGAGDRQRLEIGCVTEHTRSLDEALRARVIGQDSSLETLTCAFSRVFSALRDPKRPVLTLLLLGPTGVGKTETAKALAQMFFGWEQALTRVNCEEFAHGHEIAKLLGSPPGYVGNNIEPLLSQRHLNEPHLRALSEHSGMAGQGTGRLHDLFPAENGSALSIVLFDEIEKAHPLLWNAMLGILDDGMLTLGDNSVTDFTRSIIVMTSNVGTREMTNSLERRTLGFQTHEDPSEETAPGMEQIAVTAARELFPLEFLNRIDETLVYTALQREHLDKIFEKFLSDIHARAINQAGVPLLIKVGPKAKELILERGTDVTLGARPLRRAMDVELVDPLSRLIATQQLGPGDVVEVERDEDHLAFYRRQAPDTAIVT